MDDQTAALARLTFNAAAQGTYFESKQWLRMRIEGGTITLRPATSSRGADPAVELERRPRGGLVVDLPDDKFSNRILRWLVRAGLSENEPHFHLQPAAYGWIGLAHAEGEKTLRTPMVTVSDFTMPEKPAARANHNIQRWQRFMRAIAKHGPDEVGWPAIREMLLAAKEMTARRQRGRQSAARIEAEKLLASVGRRANQLMEWQDRHPELMMGALLEALEIPVPEREVEQVVPEDFVQEETKAKRSRKSKAEPEPEPEPVEEAELESVDDTETEAAADDPEPEAEDESEGEGEDAAGEHDPEREHEKTD